VHAIKMVDAAAGERNGTVSMPDKDIPFGEEAWGTRRLEAEDERRNLRARRPRRGQQPASDVPQFLPKTPSNSFRAVRVTTVDEAVDDFFRGVARVPVWNSTTSRLGARRGSVVH